MRTLILASVVLASLAAGCSSSGSGQPSKGDPTVVGNGPEVQPEISSDTTWTDGTNIATPVTIDQNSTVTIAAGATIHVTDGVQITVNGTLKSAGGGAHATLTATGTWVGIVANQGATVTLDGVDFENADAPIDAAPGNKAASFDNGTITNALAPFVVEHGGVLTTKHAKVVGSRGTSHVQGTFTASYLDYDASGHDGITAEHDDAKVSIEDSTLHGNGTQTDMVVSYLGASMIHVAYTTIEHAHCAFHVERVSSLEVDHVTAQSNTDGAMIYGSLASGSKSITATNFIGNNAYGIDEQDGSVNGPVSISGCYFSGNGVAATRLQVSTQISVSGDVTAPIADAKPR